MPLPYTDEDEMVQMDVHPRAIDQFDDDEGRAGRWDEQLLKLCSRSAADVALAVGENPGAADHQTVGPRRGTRRGGGGRSGWLHG